jgi:uncharacterized repeat protein (TIGR04138 family)
MMTMHQNAIFEIVRRDPRYAYQAYDFMFEALAHTQKKLGKVPEEGNFDPGPEYHVKGPELLHGACDLARQEFGLLAKAVFRQWGIHRTGDVGEIVFNLIEAELLCQTDSDHRSDFENVFDIDRELTEGYPINLDEVAWGKRGSS